MRKLLIIMIIPLWFSSMEKVKSLKLKSHKKKSHLKKETSEDYIIPISTRSEPDISTLWILDDTSSSENQCEQKQKELELKVAEMSRSLCQLSNENHSLRQDYNCFRNRVYFVVSLLLSMNILALFEKLI